MLCLCMYNKHVVQCIVESSVCSGAWCVHCRMVYTVDYAWCEVYVGNYAVMYIVKYDVLCMW